MNVCLLCAVRINKSCGKLNFKQYLQTSQIRKLSQKLKHTTFNTHLNENHEDLTKLNAQLPVINLNNESKYVDLGYVKSNKSYELNDAQKLKSILLSQNQKISKSVYLQENGIILNETKTLSGCKSKPIEETKLINAVQPSNLEWLEQTLQISQLPSHYAKLSKIRLTGLVVMTTIAGYAMAPGPIEPLTLIFATIGTGLMSGAANTINQFLEVPFDSQMSRTKNRVLVRGYLSPLHAAAFASAASISGLSMLYFGANGLTAALGVANLLLYTMVYTPMKRYSIINTWVGSVVGAIPPMMGWSACCGTLDVGAWLMAGLLFAWQFPHFNALSWNLRPDYSRAGYRMMSVINPRLCKITSLRYSISIALMSLMAPVMDVTTWTFAIDSLPLNGFFIYRAWQFYNEGDSQSSRKLFLLSLIHLPALMVLMLISKKHYSKPKDEEKDSNFLSDKSRYIMSES